ncbi:hypothetical protein [Pandoraea apista]|uniref:ATP--cob(I)alamin adenosyltransferase n=1 Tax=Pandoraea apista TaxID=93218 RepID=A0A0B5F6C8_9BURK|nr:hypothetical protein [Pandoraea apista]AJE99784.1 hypothetical protein SG18_19105 [Pandoraea apista]AKH73916.1 hypothetical protein XM39_19295 [Pandoraea apista]AKI62463.1 hypothetical protein AA956_12610 [Pandoraea apista]ALS64186.1 hypothetical protein AT395_03490 [Pandoraea apista]AVF40721.1 hypothetical protein AL486_14120 [Pandoraea apista]
MPLDPNRFSIHDVRELPFVVFNQEAADPGYARDWEAEMTALVNHGQPFVVVYDQLTRDETHEDRKQRAIWLKQNKTALAAVCKALVSIEPSEARRAEVRAMGVAAVKAFGIPHEAVATREEAIRLAHRLTQAG